jgi:transposase InsO family protein
LFGFMAREEVPMSLRRTIVEIDPSTLNVTGFCAQHGVSTWFFWDLRRRVALEGAAALEPKSRAPQRVSNKTPVEVEDEIVRVRKELVDAGLDAGPATIAFHLRDLPGLPHEATIWRILSARGLVTSDPSKAPKRARRSFTAERANDCWQLDDTDWALADGQPVKILNVVDDHSRLAVASTAMLTCTGAATLVVLAAAAVVVGWPARFLSDNATAFRHTLATALAPLGVAAGHSRPYHPQTCGKVERFHQTLKRWLAKQPPAATLEELQAQLDLFRLIYNHHRPHRGIDRQRPADVWATAPKSGPADRPLATPTKIHHSTIHNGTVFASRYSIAVGARHNTQRALTVITGTACHVFIDGHLVRHLTLDPTRRRQPIYPTTGRPPATVRKDPRHA